MTRKALLVALRELAENVRTKSFWIGMLALPLIIGIAIGVSVLFAMARDVRQYAVIDQSGWLLGEVENRAAYDDVERLLRLVREKARGGEVAKLPAPLKPLAESLKDATDEQVSLAAQAMSAKAGAVAGMAGPDATLPVAIAQAAEGQAADVYAWLATLAPEDARKVGGGLSRSRYQRRAIPADVADPEAWAREQLEKKDDGLFAYFVIGPDPVAGSAGCKYVSNNATDEDLKNWMSRLATSVVQGRRFDTEGVARELVEKIQEPLRFEEKKLGAEGVEAEVSLDEKIRQHAPMAFSYLLYISVLVTASKLLTNTIEEKSNRLMEVLLSSVSPFELMVGKVLGTASTGLAIVLSWVLFAGGAVVLVPALVSGEMPFDLGAIVSDPRFVVSFVVYFMGGYLLYAAMLVAIGSVVNSLQEAQNLLAPVNIVLILPLLALVPVNQDPNGTLAKVLSFIPLFTPFVMMNRAAGPPAVWEYVVTSVLLLATLWLMFWMAAKVFRIGILMTGKPPKLKEILGWLRAPVGAVPERRE